MDVQRLRRKDSVREHFPSSQESHHQVGFRVSWLKLALLLPPALLPIPVGLLLAYWFRHAALRLIAWRVPLKDAQFVVLKDQDSKYRVEVVRTLQVPWVEGSPDESSDEAIGILPRHQSVRYFEHRHIRYLYCPDHQTFLRLEQMERGQSFDQLHSMVEGLSTEHHNQQLLLNGKNLIDVPVKPIYALFIDEVLHPFYIFEFVTVIFWLADQYYYYSACIILIQIISIAISLFQTRREARQLHDMVVFSNKVTVIRDGREERGVPSEALVPGDVLVVPAEGMTMSCDAVLVSGTAIVNESMLTGESVPVMKTALPPGEDCYQPNQHKKFTLFGGTSVIQTRYYKGQKVLAVVVNTAFWTAKGELVRSILFPKPLNAKLWKDSIKFIGALAVMAAGGVAYSLAINLVNHYDVSETVFRSLDVVTILVPPALPAALTISTVYAISRLKKNRITCISPQRINLSGKVKLACFDKTGTLTGDSLELLGLRPCASPPQTPHPQWTLHSDRQARFSELVSDARSALPDTSPFLQGMATCHSLTVINGRLSGDPLDLKLFAATGWVLEEPEQVESSRYDVIVPCVVHPNTPQPVVELGVMKQFTFSSDLKRMSVLVRSLPCPQPNLVQVFVKGAPEVLQTLCLEAGLPEDFDAVLSSLTRKGYRVLALAHKTMQVPWHKMDSLPRSSVESGLQLLGLIVLQNKLKPETAPVIQELEEANIRTVMATGDNILTAVCVARQCGMVRDADVVQLKVRPPDPAPSGPGPAPCPAVSYHLLSEGGDDDYEDSLQHSAQSTEGGGKGGSEECCLVLDRRVCLAIDGPSLEAVVTHCPELVPQLLVHGKVFARVSPAQKQYLVEELQAVGYSTVMCGDGANDCGALKAAHAGISLSETEASIASPFTSKQQNIQCVPILLREGRASLVTSFSLFQFMALYSIAEFVTAATLYSVESNLGDFQYLFVDLILALAVSFGMGYSGPARTLARRRPLGTLVGPQVVSSLLLHCLWIVLFQMAVWFYMQTTLWFQPIVPDPEGTNIVCYENSILFIFSNFQYIILAVVLSSGPPYRQPLYCNLYLMVAVGLLLPLCLFLALAPPFILLAPPLSILQIKQSPSWKFRVVVVEAFLLNFIVAYIAVKVLGSEAYKSLVRILRRKKKFKNKYKHILQELKQNPNWPPKISAQ